MNRIYLSPPHMGGDELELVREAFASNWIAPLGPHVDAFEREVGAVAGVPHAAALASGTAALHLAMLALGVQSGDALTFSASANPILYQGAKPVFVDSGPESWNIDSGLLKEELDHCAARGCLPKAVIAVDLYGECADYDRILEVCAPYGVSVVEDAAEALGSTLRGRPAGGFGTCAVFSFNGNKIITASGGGMLVSSDGALIEQARFLATQARDPAPHYQHSQLGYNYRMSNILAAIGRGQLRVLRDRVAARRRNAEYYRSALCDLPGIGWMPCAPESQGNRWLTCITIDPEAFGADREAVRLALATQEIESRPVWKPLHLQPVFAGSRVRGGSLAEKVFERGLCLPSGSSLTEADLERICGIVRSVGRG